MSRHQAVSLAGRHAVVTGASKGIGLAITRELAHRRCRVTTIARSTELLATMAADLGTNPLELDLAQLDHCAGLLQRIEGEHGKVDILINNAAHPGAGALAAVGAQTLRDALTVNLLAPMELSRQAAHLMQPRGAGTIVNMSSVAGELAMRNMSLYGAPKAALTHLTGYLQRELRGTGVNAMLVFLGEVAGTDLVKVASADPVVAQVVDRFAALPSLSTTAVASAIVGGIEEGRPRVILPRFLAPLFYLRRSPSLLTDLLIPRTAPTSSPEPPSVVHHLRDHA
jgi:short-subunit dehydrogenase